MASPESGGRVGITAVLESFPAYIAYVDSELVYRFANSRYRGLLGRGVATIVDRPVAEILGAEAFAVAEPRLRQALSGEPLSYEAEFRFPEREPRWLAVNYIPDRGDADADRGIFVFAIDISRRKRAEEEARNLEANLRQAQKMEAVGTLAGGVAHDFNNILQTILGYTEGAMGEPGLPPAVGEDLTVIEEACRRGAGLTSQLLAFSRQQVLTPEVLDAGEAVASVLKMIRRLIGEDIELRQVRDAAPCCVKADEGQLAQILMNLAVNARDAMPDGGSLTFATASRAVDDAFCRTRQGMRPGDYVAIVVRDTGVGMAPEVRERIFEPFFTTKTMGHGTGLGLATVFGIVKQHEGYIDVESAPGGGSTFTVYLPRVDREAPAPSVTAEAAGSGGGETILLVEDDPDVRNLLQRRLTAAGYHVLTAANGPEAVAVHARQAAEIDAVVMDVVLPGLDGRQAFARMRAEAPDLRVLFMSGYPLVAGGRVPEWDSGVPLLRKPFSNSELQAMLRRVLDAPES